MLAGIGFTVSLLIGELAFGYGTPDGADVKIAVLAGSVIAGLLAAIVLSSRNAAYRRIHEAETADDDHDGVPDVYESRAGLKPGRVRTLTGCLNRSADPLICSTFRSHS